MDIQTITSTALILLFIYFASNSIESKLTKIQALLERMEHKVYGAYRILQDIESKGEEDRE